MRIVRTSLLALLLVGSPIAAQKPAAAAAKSDPKAEVMVPINQFLNSFNKGDMKTAAAACASPASVIDEFPPHVWQGANACVDWTRDFQSNAKATGITEPKVTINSVRLANITGDRAYVVTVSSYDWKQNGKPMKERDSNWTFSLQKIGGAWRINGWAWTEHDVP